MSGVSTKSIDHLGLVAGMIEELGIKESIELHLPTKSNQKKVSHATAVAAMILNGLGYANKRLYLTPRFFEKKATTLLLGEGITADDLNKDVLGRTLDAIYTYGISELYEKIAHKAVSNLGIPIRIAHLDSTSFHVDGVYNSDEEKNEGVVHIVKGYSRDHHPELNQVVLNLIVEHQAGIPLIMQAADGNQVDSKAFSGIVKAHIDALKSAADTQLTLIADAALFTKKGIEVVKEKEIDFISRVPMHLKDAKRLIAEYIDDDFKVIDENYACIKKTITYGGIKQQWILYRSRDAKKRESKTLQKTLEQESIKESNAAKKLTKQSFYCEADANKALKDFKASCHSIDILEAILIKKPKFKGKGRPKKDAVPESYEYFWNIQTAMPIDTLQKRIESSSGLFILATNNMSLSPKELLDAYKSQQRVERGFRFLKSPEFLADSLFLKKPERIEAMLMIMTLCLMVYAALEYKIRKELKAQNKTFPNQLGKPVQNPTTRWIFESFHEIQVVLIEVLQQQEIANLLERNQFILDLLGSRYWRYYRVDKKC